MVELTRPTGNVSPARLLFDDMPLGRPPPDKPVTLAWNFVTALVPAMVKLKIKKSWHPTADQDPHPFLTPTKRFDNHW